MRRQTILVHHSATETRELGWNDFLEGEAVLPGFRFPIERLFAGFDPASREYLPNRGLAVSAR